MLSLLVIILSHKLTLKYDTSDIMVSPVNFQIYEELLVRGPRHHGTEQVGQMSTL